ncbi:MAG: AAA family ATPase [Lachnospiraceae bacterium]|nr:AAA family ATPase [Lachnospiraceae bacterium]
MYNKNNEVTVNTAVAAAGSDAAESKIPKEGEFCFSIETGRAIQDLPAAKKEGIIEGILTPGLNILAAPRKKGKSWMALDIALSVAGGWNFFGRKTGHGRVLYFALEDSRERLKDRINVIMDDEDAPDDLFLTCGTGHTGNKLYGDIDKCIQEYGIKLVILDVLQKVRPGSNPKKSEYENDYNDIGRLKSIADKHGITILAVTHTKKTKDSNDRLNDISGGVGITGAADTILMISSGSFQDNKESTLYITGRDVPETKLAVMFDKDTCRWKYIGTEEELEIKKEKKLYESSPVIRTIKMLLEENNGQWSGTAGELLEYGNKKQGQAIAKSGQSLSRKINKFDELLLEDSIMHIKPDKNGGPSGRKHTFIVKENAGEATETGTEPDVPVEPGQGAI